MLSNQRADSNFRRVLRQPLRPPPERHHLIQDVVLPASNSLRRMLILNLKLRNQGHIVSGGRSASCGRSASHTLPLRANRHQPVSPTTPQEQSKAFFGFIPSLTLHPTQPSLLAQLHHYRTIECTYTARIQTFSTSIPLPHSRCLH